MQKSYDTLDAEELYHLGLKASEMGNHDEAIVLLKSSLERQPDAKAQYILAAEHAEIGMYDRAIAEMTKAVEMDPKLWTAHFQLGLLQMMQQRPDAAVESWVPLQQLEDGDALKLFGTGMSHLMRNDLQAASGCLTRGIEANRSNPALNRDMQSVLNNIRSQLESGDAGIDNAKADAKRGHIFLASYDNKDDT